MAEPMIEAMFLESLGEEAYAICPHLLTLKSLASECDLVVEFGCGKCHSTLALLCGANRVVSYDVKMTRRAMTVRRACDEHRWGYIEMDSGIAVIPPCDMLFVDSLHTYDHVKKELKNAYRVNKYLVFHDTMTFGVLGTKGIENQRWHECAVDQLMRGDAGKYKGIRPAIDELMIDDPSWKIKRHDTHGHGLLVLERDEQLHKTVEGVPPHGPAGDVGSGL